MIHWYSKQAYKPMLYTKTLIINLANGSELAYWVKDQQTAAKITPWIGFYRWFFERSSSAYSIEAKGSLRVILRTQIIGFDITVSEQ